MSGNEINLITEMFNGIGQDIKDLRESNKEQNTDIKKILEILPTLVNKSECQSVRDTDKKKKSNLWRFVVPIVIMVILSLPSWAQMIQTIVGGTP